MTRLVIFGLVVLGVAAQGAGPAFPELGVDRKMFGDKSPEVFFQERAEADSHCVATLEARWKQYQRWSANLKKLLDEGAGTPAIARVETQWEAAKQRYLESTFQCGNCVMHPVKKTVEQTPQGTAHWWVGDGSCYVANHTGFKAVRDSLFVVNRYPKHSGGFRPLLEFLPVDPKSGDHLINLEVIDSTPFHAYLAIKGFVFFGRMKAFGHYMRVDIEDDNKDNPTETAIKFTAVRAPRGFEAPDVYDYHANGEPKGGAAKTEPLPTLWSMWYLNDQGYLRFFIRANLRYPDATVRPVATELLSDTLFQFHERYLGLGK